MIKNCKTCRGAGFKNYGKNMVSCERYIPSLEEEKREKDIRLSLISEVINESDIPEEIR